MVRNRVLCTLCALVLLISFGGCGKDVSTDDTTTSNTKAGSTEEVELAASQTDSQKGQLSTTTTGKQTSNKTSNKTGTAAGSSSVTTTTTKAPSVTYALEPIKPEAYYGLSELQKMPKAKEMVAAYHRIIEAAESCTTVVSMDGTLTGDEIVKVFFFYRADYPQHFWVNGAIDYSIKNGYVLQIELSYGMSGNELAQAKQSFNKEVQSLVSLAATGKDDYERELLLHDALAQRAVYRDGKNGHNAYGAIVEKQAVCEGYARAFQYVLYQAGIQCLIADGSSINPSTGRVEAHAWNVVKIGGQYYHVDLTWDDANHEKVPVMYPYFNLTTEQIETYGHTIVMQDGYTLPNCTATAENYHVKNGSRLTSYTTDTVAALLKAHPNGAHMFAVGNGAEFQNWFQTNIQEIAKKAGITQNFSYNIVNIGNEFCVWITPA